MSLSIRFSIQKSNCILLTGIAGYAFDSIWCWGNFGPSSAFSSSRRFKQAAFGFRLRSARNEQTKEKEEKKINIICLWHTYKMKNQNLPLTCCSSVMITSTAMFSIPNFVCGLSDFRCVLHIRPSSLSASLISRIRILNDAKITRELLHAIRLIHLILNLPNRKWPCIRQNCTRHVSYADELVLFLKWMDGDMWINGGGNVVIKW